MRVVLPLLVTTLMSAGCRVEPLLTVGRHCVDDSQCAEGLVCDRNNGRCARARAFDLGPDSRDALLSPDGPLVDIRVDGSSDGAARDSTADTSPGTPC